MAMSESEHHEESNEHEAPLDPHAEDPEVQRVQFEQLRALLKDEVERNVDRFDDVTLEIAIELGRVTKPIQEILDWKEGAIVETRKLSGQPMEIMVNGKLFGRGEVVVVGDNLAIRITDLIKPDLE